MDKIASFMLTVLLALTSSTAFGQADQPRVLIIGDSIAGMYTSQVATALKDKVKVEGASRPSDMVLNSSTILEHLDQFLGRIDRNGKPVPEDQWPAWDLIHVNVGLGDLLHCMPDLESIRLLPIPAGGVVLTDPIQYEQNLDELIGQIKAKNPGAKIVWANTTPIRFSRSKVFRLGSEIEYNAIAERVMKKHGVPINDMYNYVINLIDMDKPAGHGADPFFFDRKPLHPPIVKIILQELNLALAVAEE